MTSTGKSIEIPFSRPYRPDSALRYVEESLASDHTSGDGPFTRRCCSELAAALDAPKVLLTPSCTHALELAALLLDLKPGDEVIVPSFTFVSTGNAFALRGAHIIFADIRPDTWNLDEAQLAALVTPRTRAVVPVHYNGVGCEMDQIVGLARSQGLAVVEDNAHGLLALYRGRPLGTFGELGCLSFHESKNFACGEGGGLVINAAELEARAEIIREKGTDRSRFLRGLSDRYWWLDIGSSYLMADPLAAILLAQLEARDHIQGRRRDIWERYQRELAPWALAFGVTLQAVPAHCQPAYHLFGLVLPTHEAREALIAHLRTAGIRSTLHYVPLHLSPGGRRVGSAPLGCPVAERVADRLLRLPLFTDLSPDDQDRVIEAVTSFVPA